MAKKKNTHNKASIVGSKKGLESAYTGSELINLLQGNKVTIGLNSFYKMYTENTDLRSGIRKIANKVAVKGMFIVDDNEEVLEIPGLIKALTKVFTDPERHLKTFQAWKREAIKDYFIAGEIFILPIINGTGQLQNFQILDPRTMTKIYTREGIITSFRQTSGTLTREWEADKIGYYKLETDPYAPVNGLSLLYSVIWDVLTDNKASQRNYYFFENDKMPRAIMKLGKDFDYGDENTKAQVQKLRDGLNGTDKSNKTVLSNLIEDVKVIEMSNRDMEFVQQRKLTTDKVCSLLGIPKSQLGYIEGINYASAQQFYTDFINETIKPLMAEFQDILNDLVDRFSIGWEDKNIKLETDDGVDVYKLHEDQRKDVETGILEINEVRADRGLGDKEVSPES